MATPRQITLWHTDVLPKETQKALEYCSTQGWLKRSHWYLAGGTALTLQIGHRQSLDLDFFLPNDHFSQARLLKHFAKNVFQTYHLREGAVYGILHGAKVSFIAYPFFIPRQVFLSYGSVHVLDKRDIAVMKIIAISQRGTKRDFLDLYWYCTHEESLFAILLRVSDQYPIRDHNTHHILTSLTYFHDAEKDPMPELFVDADWKKIKTYFTREIPKVAKKILKFD